MSEDWQFSNTNLHIFYQFIHCFNLKKTYNEGKLSHKNDCETIFGWIGEL